MDLQAGYNVIPKNIYFTHRALCNVYRLYVSVCCVMTGGHLLPLMGGGGTWPVVMMQRLRLVWSPLDGSTGPAHLRSQMDEAEEPEWCGVSTSPSHLSRVSQLRGEGHTRRE